MNTIKLKYQISLFGNFDNILPTPTIVKKLMEIMQNFNSYNLLLNTVNELTIDARTGTPTQVNRISFTDQHSGFHILFGAKRLDFIKELRDESGNNLGNLDNYINEIKGIVKQLSNSFQEFITFNRLSLVTDYFIDDITDDKKDEIYKTLFNDIFSTSETTKEWNIRIVDKENNTDINEIINKMISFDRLQGQLLIKNKIKDIDEIKLMIDINTDTKNTNLRFQLKDIETFLSYSLGV